MNRPSENPGSSRKPKGQPRGDLAKLADRLPPHSTEAEMCLIGSLMLAGTENVHLIGDVMAIIKSPADFYWPKHAAIYDAIRRQYEKRGAIDPVLLANVLEDTGQIDAVGGVDYLIELTESVPVSTNAPHYARIVRDKAKLRQLIDAAGRTLTAAYEPNADAAELAERVEQEVFAISEAEVSSDTVGVGELAMQTMALIEQRRANNETLKGLDCGYYQLNDLLNGLQNGELIIIAARPSMGKTALALNIAEYIGVTCKQPTAIFSLEMSKQQLAERMLSARAGVDGQRIRKNMLSDEELGRLGLASRELADSKVFIDDMPGMSIALMRSKARRLLANHGVKAIIVDYLQLMSSPGAESRVQEVSAISRGLKNIARELCVPVIALSQLNRNTEGRTDKRPMLSDLRESGSIEQDADTVMMLHREEYYHLQEPGWKAENPDLIGVAEVIVAKQRNGPTGIVPLQFNAKTTSFHNAAPAGIGEGM